MKRTDLARYDKAGYQPGHPAARVLWYLMNRILLYTTLPYPSVQKAALLRAFGARVGRHVVIKPRVYVKYPWRLQIDDRVWLGEMAWIDNLALVEIGSNVVVSQGSYVGTGNHDYKSVRFDLRVSPVRIEDGVWIGARSVVCPGVTIGSHAVLCAGTVLTHDAEPYTVYRGNPGRPVRRREIAERTPPAPDPGP